LYEGKLVAALDRHHPRDLFDAKLLLDAGGLTDEVRTAFVVYLASHSRPMAEILDPSLKPLQKVFDSEFAGMTRQKVTCDELLDTRAQLIRLVRSALTETERRFLMSLKSGEPWDLLPVRHLAQMPAIQWKLKNIHQLARRSQGHEAAIEKLRKVLGL